MSEEQQQVPSDADRASDDAAEPRPVDAGEPADDDDEALIDNVAAEGEDDAPADDQGDAKQQQ